MIGNRDQSQNLMQFHVEGSFLMRSSVDCGSDGFHAMVLGWK
jgi:hypothetical protein